MSKYTKATRPSLSVENLEDRVTPSATVINGDLCITGSAYGDVVQVSKVGSNYKVVENGTCKYFACSRVYDHEIRFYGNGGNDNFRNACCDLDTFAWGGAGNDILVGCTGQDVLDGGDGSDTLMGGAGEDRMTGGAGNDTMNGGVGDDTLGGGAGNDQMDGATGEDTLTGGVGNDQMNGGTEDDQLDGGAGTDRMNGGGGDDVLCCGYDNVCDYIYGGWGNDDVQQKSSTDQIYECEY